MNNKKYPVTDPVKDPNEVYPEVPGINYDDFKLTPKRMPEAQRKRALKQVHDYESEQKRNFLGYQANQAQSYEKTMGEYLNYHINNIGDPFTSGNYTINSKFAERAVLDYFASLWNAQWPHENTPDAKTDEWKNSYWGYIVSMGCTEANLFGIWNARDYLSGRATIIDPENSERAKRASSKGKKFRVMPRTLYYKACASSETPNAYTPIAFYSQDTHYSIIKAMRILEVDTFNERGSGKYKCPLVYPDDYPEDYSTEYIDSNGWPFDVPSNDDGSIHIPSLVKLVKFFVEMGHPPMVLFNYGSTFKGAYDDVEKAIQKIVPILKKNGLYEREVVYDPETGSSDIRTGYWFHVDGALAAAYAPFLNMEGIDKVPNFDFRIPEIHSITLSGHKWIGAPWPCGIYMSKVRYQLEPPDNPNYIGSPDTTFAGSRNGLTALVLWEYLSRNSFEDLIQKIRTNLKNAQYALKKLQQLEKERGEDLWVEYSPRTLTLRFKEANPDITFKYSLSGEELYVSGERRSYSHIYIMEHSTKEVIDRFIEDLKAEDAFPEQTQG